MYVREVLRPVTPVPLRPVAVVALPVYPVRLDAELGDGPQPAGGVLGGDGNGLLRHHVLERGNAFLYGGKIDHQGICGMLVI